jgi:hypothetical protein
LETLIAVDEQRLLGLWPALDLDAVRSHLEAFPKICAGEAEAGPIGRLSRRERFAWLISPRSTVIQISPVHSGMCESPEATIRQLLERLVLPR